MSDLYNEIQIGEHEWGVYDIIDGIPQTTKAGYVILHFVNIKNGFQFQNPDLPLHLVFTSLPTHAHYIHDGKDCVAELEFKQTASTTITVPAPEVVCSRKELEEFLKDNKDCDNIVLSKTEKSINGLREYIVSPDQNRDTRKGDLVPDTEPSDLDSKPSASEIYYRNRKAI